MLTSLTGLGIVSSLLAGLVGLLIFMVLGKILDKTPRKMYKRWISLSGIGWGTVFPIYTNLFVIAICYAAIAPFVLIFAVSTYPLLLMSIGVGSTCSRTLSHSSALSHSAVRTASRKGSQRRTISKGIAKAFTREDQPSAEVPVTSVSRVHQRIQWSSENSGGEKTITRHISFVNTRIAISRS